MYTCCLHAHYVHGHIVHAVFEGLLEKILLTFCCGKIENTHATSHI